MLKATLPIAADATITWSVRLSVTFVQCV